MPSCLAGSFVDLENEAESVRRICNVLGGSLVLIGAAALAAAYQATAGVGNIAIRAAIFAAGYVPLGAGLLLLQYVRVSSSVAEGPDPPASALCRPCGSAMTLVVP